MNTDWQIEKQINARLFRSLNGGLHLLVDAPLGKNVIVYIACGVIRSSESFYVSASRPLLPWRFEKIASCTKFCIIFDRPISKEFFEARWFWIIKKGIG